MCKAIQSLALCRANPILSKNPENKKELRMDNKKILIVDNEEVTLNLLEKRLECFSSVEKALLKFVNFFS